MLKLEMLDQTLGLHPISSIGQRIHNLYSSSKDPKFPVRDASTTHTSTNNHPGT
ncbi:uncharacterized protein TRIVIDRAFT_216172 [Trichoderma virens Gv29-8]|uniref:Uncharacterized protein n=1 Tax=Hypocrea virens (strain Gv29-8 / FGSC 10586) TaxID=413071 RepID=G9MUL3_HYPVG|nr:uncharacterized protein TRIVIDRAFT_216172 [Trichoderma virens Gv29-8]EHK21854.1 hypothetical protein TRIVIDRAFT_216172 [Trichoderma virens Gv29-8]